MVLIIGLLAALLIFLLFAPDRLPFEREKRRIGDLYTPEAAHNLSQLPANSLEYKLLAAGIRLQPITFKLLCVSGAAAGAVITWALLPGLPAIAAGALIFYIPFAWLDGKVKSRGQAIDKLLPLAIGRITAGLLAGGAVPDVLEEVGNSMAVEGANPLTPELLLTAAEMRNKNREEALGSLAARSPSTSLSNLAYLLEGYLQAGGGAYARVLSSIAQKTQQILVARNRSQAKAGDAMVSAKVIPGVLALILAYLAQDATIRGSLSAFPVQIAIAVGMGSMALGYSVMRSMIMEAV